MTRSTTTTTGIRRAWLSAAITASTALVACGDDAADDAGEDVIQIGLLVEQADTADTRKETAVALLAIREVNEGGGVRIDGQDYELDLVGADHGGEPDTAVQAIARLSEQGVTATVGPPWSSLALGRMADHSDGVSLKAREYDMLLISPSATASAITDLDDDDLQWRVVASDSVQSQVAAQTILEEGIMTASILHRDEPWGNGLAAAFEEAYEAGGGTVLSAVPYDVDGEDIADVKAHDYNAELDAVFAEQPGVVLLFTFDEAFQITNRIVLGGYLDDYAEPPLFFGSDGNHTSDLLVNGHPDVLRNMWGTTPHTDETRPEFQDFYDLGSDTIGGLDLSDGQQAARFDAVMVLALAMQRADSVAADDVKQHLQAVTTHGDDKRRVGPADWGAARQALLAGEEIDYEGAVGPIELTDSGDPGAGTYTVWKVEERSGGRFDYDLTEVVDFGAVGR